MPDFTPNLNLEQPKRNEGYDVQVQNRNMIKIDDELQQQKDTFTTQLAHIAIDLKSAGAVGDDIMDDTSIFASALNTNNTKFYLPNGRYQLTDTITVNGSGKKIVEGQSVDNTILSVKLLTSKNLFVLNCNVEFKNLTLDFNNMNCQVASLFARNLGLIKLTNVRFINLKDVDSTTSTRLVHIPATGNSIDINNVVFDTILKRGNGNVADANGSVNGIYYTDDVEAPGGLIQQVSVKNMHNINANDEVIFEDTTGIYIATLGKKANVTISNVRGYDFGKRLVKLQASKIYLENIFGESHQEDTLSVVGALSEAGLFTSEDVTMKNVTAIGNMSAAIATYAANTLIDNAYIDLYVNRATTGADTHEGIWIDSGTSNTTIRNSTIKARRPITVRNATSIDNLLIDSCALHVKKNGQFAITHPAGSYNNINNLTIQNTKVYLYNSTENGNLAQALINTSASLLSKSKLFVLRDIDIITTDSSGSNREPVLGHISDYDGLDITNVKFVNFKTDSIYGGDILSIEDCEDVSITNLKIKSVANRHILIRRVNDIDVGVITLKGNATALNIAFFESTKGYVAAQNEMYSIGYGTQDATEIYRAKCTTAQRYKYPWVGLSCFDMTLGKQINYSGTSWIDPSGAAV